METSPTEAPRRRSTRGPKDLAISLLVLVVPILLLVGIYQWVFQGDAPIAVDQSGTVAEAEAAGLTVVEPEGLGSDWVPVSAALRESSDGLTLRLGFVTPEREGVQVIQSTVPPESLLPAELGEGPQPRGNLDIAGRSWQSYDGRSGESALVLLAPEQTVMVVGPASEAELRELAAAL